MMGFVPVTCFLVAVSMKPPYACVYSFASSQVLAWTLTAPFVVYTLYQLFLPMAVRFGRRGGAVILT